MLKRPACLVALALAAIAAPVDASLLPIPKIDDLLKGPSLGIPGIDTPLSLPGLEGIDLGDLLPGGNLDNLGSLGERLLGKFGGSFCLGEICPSTADLQGLFGALGLPNFAGIPDLVSGVLNRDGARSPVNRRTGGAFGLTPALFQQLQVQEVEVAAAEVALNSAIGADAQAATVAAREQVTVAALGSLELAHTAQSQAITQNVMKLAAQQQAQQVQIDRLVFDELVLNRVATNLNTQVLVAVRKHQDRTEQLRLQQTGTSVAGSFTAFTTFSAALYSGR